MSASGPRKCTGCGADAPSNVVSGLVRCDYCGATFQVGAPAAAPAPAPQQQQPQVVVVQLQAPPAPAPHQAPQPYGAAPGYAPAPMQRPYAPPRPYTPPRPYAPAPKRGGGCAKTIVLLVVLAVLAVVTLSCVGLFVLGSVEAPPPGYGTQPPQ